MSRKFRLLLGAFLSIALLFLVFQDVDLARTAKLLRTTRYAYLVPAVTIMLLVFVIKAFRWQVLLQPMVKMQVRSLMPAVMIGYFSNYFLPVNTGELVRAFVLGRGEGVSNSAVLGTIVVERMMDVLVLIGFLLAALLAWPLPKWVRSMALLGAMVLVAGWFILSLMLWQRERTCRLIQTTMRRASSPLAHHVARMSERFLEGLEAMHSNWVIAWTAVLTCLLWGFTVVVFYLIGQALGLTLSPLAYSLPVAIINLGTVIPALPGRVGTLEALCVSSLALFAIEDEVGLAFVLLLRTLHLAPIAWGWFHLYRTGFHLLNIHAHGQSPEIKAAR